MEDATHTAKTDVQTVKMLLKREIASLEEQVKKKGDSKNQQRDPVWLRQIASSILAAKATIPAHASKISLLNIKTGTTEEVSVNPKLSPDENAALFEKKARKVEKECGEIASTSQPLVDRCAALRAALTTISGAIENRDLSEWQKSIASASALVNYQPEQKTIDENPQPTPPFRHFEKNGWHIFAGKTEEQNDELSIKFAAPADVWFHAAGCAGSHVIIQRPKGAPPPDEAVIRAAAAVAGWFSKSRNAPNAEIHYTEARSVHKRKGAPAGEVMLEKFSSLKVKPESPEMLFR